MPSRETVVWRCPGCGQPWGWCECDEEDVTCLEDDDDDEDSPFDGEADDVLKLVQFCSKCKELTLLTELNRSTQRCKHCN